jgi:hypothetical protein
MSFIFGCWLIAALPQAFGCQIRSALMVNMTIILKTINNPRRNFGGLLLDSKKGIA